MKYGSQHTEWLSLIDVSGPFLAVSVLEEAFPQGLDTIETPRRQRLRAAYEEWCESVEDKDPQLKELHDEWIRLVLHEILDYDSEIMLLNEELDNRYSLKSLDGAETFSPKWVICRDRESDPLMFISSFPPGFDFSKLQQKDNSAQPIIERMISVCRSNNVRLGLLTNGECWTLINAPIGNTSGSASWYSRLWFQEPITLKSFQSLLNVRRFFSVPEQTLVSLLNKSLEHQDVVTDTLGEQVRRAIEVLVQCLDKADEDRNRELMKDVSSSELYEAGLTVMMRLVFLLCAEERGLILSDDPIYNQYYAISTLRSQLAEEADLHGPEVLDRRFDAWARLLAVFRGIYGGIEHESLRMPAFGGTLFDPDKYPFLEGRAKGSKWSVTNASPLPIDNRTVLLLLNSLQILEQPSGAQLLSYRSLDVEQIGHVYEGLLEHTIIRIEQITLGLKGSQKAKNPNITLAQIESARLEGESSLIGLLHVTTHRSQSAIRTALARDVDLASFERLLGVCGGDLSLAERIRPYFHLLRMDAWDAPIIYGENSFIVTVGVDRRETGTHYTPKSLTESIVSCTLEPLVYDGVSEGKSREKWKLKAASDLLNLKICDPAMGSGAFLVQACRWLAEKVVEAWSIAESNGKFVSDSGEVVGSAEDYDPMPEQLEHRLILAKRLIAERCLYGVDVNPLAVELAKLSIWLVTLAKNRPFGFLDHNFRVGNSVLGIANLEQLTKLSFTPEKELYASRLFAQDISTMLNEALKIRRELRLKRICDVRDIETVATLDSQARTKLKDIKLLADLLVSVALSSRSNKRYLEAGLEEMSTYAHKLVDGQIDVINLAERKVQRALSNNLLRKSSLMKPFHWILEYPEVFSNDSGGFDAIIGNPPFIGGRRMRASIGDSLMSWLSISWPHASMNADYCAFFFLKAASLVKRSGTMGLLATKTISEGDTAQTGLSYILDKQSISIINALSSFLWPGGASVNAALVVGYKGNWHGAKYLDNKIVDYISASLDDQDGWGQIYRFRENVTRSFQGSVLVGTGFILTEEEAHRYIDENPQNQLALYPYLSGEDINTNPRQRSSRWVIDFRNLSLEECKLKWPDLLDRVRHLVKPQRDETRREAHRKYWWHHGDKRPALYERIKNKSEIFVISRVTKYVALISVPAKQVFSDAVCILDLPSWSSFAALQCTFHELWVRKQSSSMKSDIRYAPSDCFDTYPFIKLNDKNLEQLGYEYHELRKRIMVSNNIGLTATYNRFHDPNDDSNDIQMLREIHLKMDRCVANAYDWGDLELEYDFRETKQGIRYTISDEESRKILKRLLEINHRWFLDETEGVNSNEKKPRKSTGSKAKKNSYQNEYQTDLFEI